jgi:hypothetical protein
MLRMHFVSQMTLPPAPLRLPQWEAGRPRVSHVATQRQVRPRSEPLQLPGGTTTYTISLRRLVHNCGLGEFPRSHRF